MQKITGLISRLRTWLELDETGHLERICLDLSTEYVIHVWPTHLG